METFGYMIMGLGAVGLGIGLYFVPSMIARSRSHPQLASLMMVNLLFGWTVIGWGVSLAWAYWQFHEPVYEDPRRSFSDH